MNTLITEAGRINVARRGGINAAVNSPAQVPAYQNEHHDKKWATRVKCAGGDAF